jgi:hypothetical protein
LIFLNKRLKYKNLYISKKKKIRQNFFFFEIHHLNNFINLFFRDGKKIKYVNNLIFYFSLFFQKLYKDDKSLHFTNELIYNIKKNNFLLNFEYFFN